jgi:hypothetical protein
MWRYYLGCAALGFTSGFLVGGSASPVVQYVLPLLFALLGGAAGILSLSTNPASESSRNRFEIVGMAAFALTMPFLIASAYATLLRTDKGISVLVPSFASKATEETINSAVSGKLSSEDIVELLIVSQKLKIIGIRDKERSGIVKRISEERARENASIINSRGKTINLTDGIEKALNDELKENVFNDQAIVSLLLDFSIYRSVTSVEGSPPSKNERDAMLKLKGDFTDASSLTPDIAKLLFQSQTVGPLVNELKAQVVQIRGAYIVDDQLKKELSDSVDQIIKVQSVISGQDVNWSYAVND